MDPLFNATTLELGHVVKVSPSWFESIEERAGRRWDPLPSILFYVDVLSTVAGDAFAELVPVDPGERHKRVTASVDAILRASESVYATPTSPGAVKVGGEYEFVTTGNAYKVLKLTGSGVKVDFIPPSTYGPHEIGWLQFCSHVTKTPETW
jgi:hypothetical protein